MIMFYLWLIIAIGFGLFEIGSPGLFLFLSFSIGSLVAAIAAWAGVHGIAQCLLFLAASIVSVIILVGWVRHCYGRLQNHERTNAHALLGKQARVVEEIRSDKPGQVNVAGELWRARSADGKMISVGVRVEIISVSGSHVMVRS